MKQWQVRRKNDILDHATSFKDGCDKLRRWLGSYSLGIEYGWRVVQAVPYSDKSIMSDSKLIHYIFSHDWSASRMGDHECAICTLWLPGFKERPEYGCVA